MKREFGSILLVGSVDDAPTWLVSGAPHGTRVVSCSSTSEAREMVDHAPPRIVLVESRDADGSETETLLVHVLHRHPSVATIAVTSRRSGDPDQLLRVARCGVHALLFEEDARAPLIVRRTLNEAATRCRNQHVWTEIAPLTPDRVRPIVDYGLRHANEVLTVDRVARALGLHRKTLAERCALSGTLAPQQVLGWCRLLAAAVLLEDRRRRVEHVAMELDFPSGAAFRNLLKRYTGLSPAELRAKGTTAEMSRRFRRAMMTGDWHDEAIRAG